VCRDFEKVYPETAHMEAEPNFTQEKELGRDEGEVYSREDRQGNSVAESGSNAISASQFQELMKEF
jgi:hypothetical protein